MKSILFRRLDLTKNESSDLKRDISIMLSVENKELTTIVKSLPSILNKTIDFSRKAEIDKLAEETKVQAETISVSVAILEFFFKQFLNDDLSADTPSMWADDLIESKVFGEEVRNKFVDSIELMKSDLFESIKKEILEVRMKAGVLPTFNSINTTVELRTVIDKDYIWGTSINDFSPKIIGWVPIVSIDIMTDSANDKHTYFQGSIEDINIIIQELAAAIKIAETAHRT